MGNVMRGIRIAVVFWMAAVSAGVCWGHDPEGVPHWQEASGWPDRVVTTFGADPTTSFSVTWRTDATVGRTIAQIVEASADARFDLLAETVPADTERVELEGIIAAEGVAERPYNHGLGAVHYHSVTFTKLAPGTKYAWRVQGARGDWTEWYQTRTAPAEGPTTFVYFGDAQQGIRSHWSRVIRAAYEAAPEADFFLHAGDLVQRGDSDYNWAEWFDAGSYLHARIPSVPVVGNHEYIPVEDPKTGKGSRVLTPLWRAQFTLPVVKELPESLHEAVYDVRYGEDLHVFVVNSAPSDFEVQAKWLDEQLAKTTATWRVVTMHHPYFVPVHSRQLADNAARQKAFTGVVEKHQVDLVIVGHIHTYLRSTGAGAEGKTSRLAVGEPRDVQTVFVISSAGAGVGQIQKEKWVRENVGDGKPDKIVSGASADRTAGNTPMFQVIRIDGGKLEYAAHTAVGDVYDRFTVEKEDGRKQLIEGEEAFGEMRLFENTGPYREWHDLR